MTRVARGATGRDPQDRRGDPRAAGRGNPVFPSFSSCDDDWRDFNAYMSHKVGLKRKLELMQQVFGRDVNAPFIASPRGEVYAPDKMTWSAPYQGSDE